VSTAPAPVTTSSGAVLPLVALPQGKLLSVSEKNIPLIKDALGPGVHVQPLRLDIEAGVWVVLATFTPGSRVPLHYHTGVAEVYTLSGSWHYLEHPDQSQTAGSYLYEPGASVHTFICPESNTEDTVARMALRHVTTTELARGSVLELTDGLLCSERTCRIRLSDNAFGVALME
jgi:2,4'-dihydroxyacetophenone dioxygenase